MKPHLAALAVIAAGALTAAQTQPPLKLGGENLLPRDSVTFLGPEFQQVSAGAPSPVTLRFRITPGLHINSHAPNDKFLLPTKLLVIEAPGLTVDRVDFPPGEEYAFAFDRGTHLSVYSGEFLLQATVTAQHGQQELHGVLRYQACDHAACYPPRTLPIEVKLLAR